MSESGCFYIIYGKEKRETYYTQLFETDWKYKWHFFVLLYRNKWIRLNKQLTEIGLASTCLIVKFRRNSFLFRIVFCMPSS